MTAEPPSDPPHDEPAEDAEVKADATEAKPDTAGEPAAAEAPAAEAVAAEAVAGESTPAAPKRRRTRRAPKAQRGAQPDKQKAAETGKGRARKASAGKVEAAQASETPVTPAAAPRSAPKAAGAPTRRRVVRARARYVRTPARKARIVCVHLPGKSVAQARAILAFTPREVARDWSKLLESAVANAENNHELLEDDLIVREAYADEGPTIKRFRPRAMGRATPIRKRTSHLTITLTPRRNTTKRAG
jgi:large subunit ribosomal protein L22